MVFRILSDSERVYQCFLWCVQYRYAPVAEYVIPFIRDIIPCGHVHCMGILYDTGLTITHDVGPYLCRPNTNINFACQYNNYFSTQLM